MAEHDTEHGSDALWGGRFEDSPSDFTQVFGASLPVDQRMWEADIAGSKAHSAMLGRQGIIPQEDVEAIHAGLDDIARQMGISVPRVKEHANAIFQKIGAANRTEAVAIALRKHLLKI